MLELPRQGGSNEYPQSMFWKKITQIGIPLQTPVFLFKSGVQVDYVFLIIKKAGEFLKVQSSWSNGHFKLLLFIKHPMCFSK